MNEQRFSRRIGLAWKLLLAFGLVVIVVIGTVSILANKAAAREVRVFMLGSGMTDTDRLVQELAAYYQGRDSWQDVEELFVSPGIGQGTGRMGGMARGGSAGNITLADSSSSVVYDTQDGAGGNLTAEERLGAIPIEVGEETVGYLIVEEGGLSNPEADLIDRFNYAIWLAALAAGAVALLVGGGLVIGLLRPVRELTDAARKLAQGDLSSRVLVRTSDEVGELSSAFNQMAASLERAETLRREMTADIAHELRNPLAVMQARIEAFQDGVYSLTKENLEPLHEQSRLLNRLVEDLSTLSLADAGQLRLDLVEVDLESLLRRVIESYQAQAEDVGVGLSLDIRESSSQGLQVDPARIEQILGNLIGNALRYTPRGGEISVIFRWDVDGEKAILEVADSGEGVPEAALPKIFERFYRADRSRARQAGGTGLGLAITRKLVEAHGGTIIAANQPDGGAIFSIALPAAVRDSPQRFQR